MFQSSKKYFIFFLGSALLISSGHAEVKVVSTSIDHIQKCFPILFKFRKREEFKSLKDLQAEAERNFSYKNKIEMQRDVLFSAHSETQRLRLRYTGNIKKPFIERAKLDADLVATPMEYAPKKPLADWDALTSEVIGSQPATRIDKEFSVKTTQGASIKYATQSEKVVSFDIDDASSHKSLKCDGDEINFICRCTNL